MTATTLIKYKRHARNAAKELQYGPEIMQKIMEATTVAQIERLLRSGRSTIPDHGTIKNVRKRS